MKETTLPPVRSIWIDATGLIPCRKLTLPKTASEIRKAQYQLEGDLHKVRGACVLAGRADEVSLWYYQRLPNYKLIPKETWNQLIIGPDEIAPHRRARQIIIHGYGERGGKHFLTQSTGEIIDMYGHCKLQPPIQPEYEEVKQVAQLLRIGSVWRVDSWDQVQDVLDWVGQQEHGNWGPFPEQWPLKRMPAEDWYPPEWGVGEPDV